LNLTKPLLEHFTGNQSAVCSDTHGTTRLITAFIRPPSAIGRPQPFLTGPLTASAGNAICAKRIRQISFERFCENGLRRYFGSIFADGRHPGGEIGLPDFVRAGERAQLSARHRQLAEIDADHLRMKPIA
jgi:hypothetical protein